MGRWITYCIRSCFYMICEKSMGKTAIDYWTNPCVCHKPLKETIIKADWAYSLHREEFAFA